MEHRDDCLIRADLFFPQCCFTDSSVQSPKTKPSSSTSSTHGPMLFYSQSCHFLKSFCSFDSNLPLHTKQLFQTPPGPLQMQQHFLSATAGCAGDTQDKRPGPAPQGPTARWREPCVNTPAQDLQDSLGKVLEHCVEKRRGLPWGGQQSCVGARVPTG